MPKPLQLLRRPTRSDLVARAKVKLDASQFASFLVDEPREAGEPQLYLRGGDSPLAKTERVELIERVNAGSFIEIEMEATVFVQRESPNYNFLRFKAGDLPSLAKSYTGTPFLRNHGTSLQEDRGGTIIASKLVHGDDGKSFLQRFHLVKPWAVVSALDGTLDRFSIGWYRGGTSECSICEASWLACHHWPGELDEKTGKLCELIQVNPRGKETSYVNAPAVLGTSPMSIAQLEALDPVLLADILAADAIPGEHDDMKLLAAVIAALSLPTTTTEDEAAAAVTRQRDELTAANDQLTIVREQLSTARSTLATVQTEQKQREQLSRVSTVETGIASLLAAGKLKPGSATEAALRRQGGVTPKLGADGKQLQQDGKPVFEVDMSKSLDVFAATVDDMLLNGPAVTPVGAPLPATQRDPAPTAPTEAKALLAAKPVVASWLRTAGISEEKFEKHGENAREIASVVFGG